VPYGSASVESAWIYGLQQNAENRSNLALVNTGEIDDSSSTFEITIYDGSGESTENEKRDAGSAPLDSRTGFWAGSARGTSGQEGLGQQPVHCLRGDQRRR